MTVNDCFGAIKHAKVVEAKIECKLKTLNIEGEQTDKELEEILTMSARVIDELSDIIGGLSIDGNGGAFRR